MRFHSFAAIPVALAIATSATPVHAQQVPHTFFVCDLVFCGNTSYVGPGTDFGVAGIATEAISSVTSDAYDDYGLISSNGAFATFNRRTESYESASELPANSIRWLDSFTNTTGATIVTPFRFGGNLGSDGQTVVHAQQPGLVVTGEGTAPNFSPDPVILHLYGNNAIAASAIVTFPGDNLFIDYNGISIAPGQTISFMHYNILFSDAARQSDVNAYSADIALAIQQGQLFLNSPVFAGLTAQQVMSIINWKINLGPGADGLLPGATAISHFGTQVGEIWTSALLRHSMPGAGAQPTQSGTSNFFEPPSYLLGSRNRSDRDEGLGALTEAAEANGGKLGLFGSETLSGYLIGQYFDGRSDLNEGRFTYDGVIGGGGVEYRFVPSFAVGVAAGYSDADGDVEGAINNLDIKSTIVTATSKYDGASGLFAHGAVTYLDNEWEYDRDAGALTASGDVDGSTWIAAARVGQSLLFGPNIVTPFAGLIFGETRVDGYTETGAGNINLIVPSHTLQSLEGELGLRLTRALFHSAGTRVVGYVGGSVRHHFDDDDQRLATTFVSGASPFSSSIEGFDGTTGAVEAGLSGTVGEGLNVSADYRGVFGDDAEQHVASGRLKVIY